MATSGDMPAGIPPPGVVAVLDQKSDLWPPIVAVSVITLVVLCVSMFLRLYAKLCISKSPKWEDYLSAFAAVLLIVWTVIFDISCSLGISQHQWNVRLSRIRTLLSNLNIADLILCPMLGTAKFALVLQIRRYADALGKASRAFTCYAYATMIIIVGYYFAVIFVVAFQCTPRRGIWDPTSGAKCVSTPGAVFAEGAFALLTDLMVLALFGWLVAAAQARQLGGKGLLGSIAALALLAVACGSASLYYRTPFLGQETDLTYRIGILQIWAMVEYTAVIVTGCLPSIGMLLGGRRKAQLNVGKERPSEVQAETSQHITQPGWA